MVAGLLGEVVWAANSQAKSCELENLSLARRLRHTTRQQDVGPCCTQDGRQPASSDKTSQSSWNANETMWYSVWIQSIPECHLAESASMFVIHNVCFDLHVNCTTLILTTSIYLTYFNSLYRLRLKKWISSLVETASARSDDVDPFY